MLLTVAMTYSCANKDIPFVVPEPTVVIDGNAYKVDLLATLQGEVGAEVTLGLGVYDNFDIYGVDFGDGVILGDTVGNQNGGVKGEDGLTLPGTTHTRTTEFKGVVAGDGTVKVYGKSDIWYLNISGNLLPTAFDQPKLANVVQISITGAAADEIELPALPNLTQFNFNNSPVKKVDVSKVPTLTSLTINNMTAAPQLESIDISKNPELTYLSLQGTANGTGVLASLDLTNNTKLEGVYVQYNKIKQIKLAASYEKLGTFNASYNELEAIDPAAMPAVKWFDVRFNKIKGDLDIPSEKLTNVYVNNNELTSVKVPNVTKQFYFDNNNMTLATMPALPEGMNTTSKKKQFHYAPQADMEVAPQGSVLDLSAQASAKGIEAEAQATTFALTAGDAILMEGKDYTVSGGKITFITDQKDVLVKMNNAGYPDLTLHTKPFDVKGTGVVEEGTVVFSFFEGTATGGTVVGNGADEGKVGNEITVSSKKANIENDNITITLNEALKEGDVIKMTGYRKKDTDANGNLYILFETGEVIDEGSDVKWNNIHENVGQQPNTNSYDVNDKAAGSKVIKLARSKASTNVFIQKIEIVRK